MGCPLYSLFLRFAGVGSLRSDVDVVWFCGPSPLCLLLRDLVSDVRCFEVVATVLGSPWVVLLILCSPLGRGLGFGVGLVVLRRVGGWVLAQISCVVVVSVLGTSPSAGTGSIGHTIHLALQGVM